MSKLIIFHGSPDVVEQPVFGKGKKYNDYGRGFYCLKIGMVAIPHRWKIVEKNT